MSKKHCLRNVMLPYIMSALILVPTLSAHALPQSPSVAINIVVYVTDGNTDFHRSGCPTLYGKKITGIALGKAYQEGYSPCGQCEPPQIQNSPMR